MFWAPLLLFKKKKKINNGKSLHSLKNSVCVCFWLVLCFWNILHIPDPSGGAATLELGNSHDLKSIIKCVLPSPTFLKKTNSLRYSNLFVFHLFKHKTIQDVFKAFALLLFCSRHGACKCVRPFVRIPKRLHHSQALVHKGDQQVESRRISNEIVPPAC